MFEPANGGVGPSSVLQCWRRFGQADVIRVVAVPRQTVDRIDRGGGTLGAGIVGRELLVQLLHARALPFHDGGVAVEIGKPGAVAVAVGGQIPDLSGGVAVEADGAVVNADGIFFQEHGGLCGVADGGEFLGDEAGNGGIAVAQVAAQPDGDGVAAVVVYAGGIAPTGALDERPAGRTLIDSQRSIVRVEHPQFGVVQVITAVLLHVALDPSLVSRAGNAGHGIVHHVVAIVRGVHFVGDLKLFGVVEAADAEGVTLRAA